LIIFFATISSWNLAGRKIALDRLQIAERMAVVVVA